MLANTIATASLVLLLAHDGAASAEASPKTPTKTDFLRAMDKARKNVGRRLNEADFKKEVYGNSKSSAALRKKIMEKSVVTKAPGSGSSEEGRKLQNNNNYQSNYKYDAYTDGTDDWLATYGAWENKFGFDVTQYSASYHRCAEVKQFDDELAAQEDATSVFATKHFAVFRLCPENTCMGFVEQEADCGCTYQCAAAVSANGGDQDSCEASCATQCAIWTQQYSMYTSSGNGRKLSNNGGSSSSWDNFSFDAYYDDGSAGEMYGARGEGCQSNYGEYMLEVKEYLAIMLEWQDHRYEEYEAYCETCMYKVYQQWLKNGGDARRLSFDDFKASDEHRNLGGYYGSCPEYDTCSEYRTIKFVDDMSGYFECSEVEKANGQVAYVGPHCADDGFTITLGVYSDENCYDYIGNGIDISSFGIDVEDDALKSYYNSAMGATFEQLKYVEEDTVCIPCNSEVSFVRARFRTLHFSDLILLYFVPDQPHAALSLPSTGHHVERGGVRQRHQRTLHSPLRLRGALRQALPSLQQQDELGQVRRRLGRRGPDVRLHRQRHHGELQRARIRRSRYDLHRREDDRLHGRQPVRPEGQSRNLHGHARASFRIDRQPRGRCHPGCVGRDASQFPHQGRTLEAPPRIPGGGQKSGHGPGPSELRDRPGTFRE